MENENWGEDTLQAFRTMLAEKYPDRDSILRVLGESRVPAQYVAIDTRAANTWYSAIHEAKLRNRLGALLDCVYADYPEDTERFFGARRMLDEALTGESSALVPVYFLLQGLYAARTVGLVIASDGSVGTGFLLEDNLFVTCNHVLETKEHALTAKFRFNYQEIRDGIYANSEDFKADSDPNAFFLVSPRGSGHDFTIVKLTGNPNGQYGSLPIEGTKMRRVSLQERVNIIQHPGGELKQLSYFHNLVVDVGLTTVEYQTDTRSGSSGSPVFDKRWNLVAIHRGSRTNAKIARSEHLAVNGGTHIDIIHRAILKERERRHRIGLDRELSTKST